MKNKKVVEQDSGWEERFDNTFGRLISEKGDELVRCNEGVKMFIQEEIDEAIEKLQK